MSSTASFVANNNIPEFIKQNHEVFDSFINAYYEWLELKNDSDNSSYADVYKAVGNPGYIANNQEIVVDIDETIDEFIEYFANEVVPISLDGIQTDPRFFLKKVRELYLAKGTKQSFILFFKLYYNDDIDVFETRDTVLRASDGKFFSFPTAYFVVEEGQAYIGEVEFTLSELLDTDENFIFSILSGEIAGETPGGKTIVKIQFANDLNLSEKNSYYIRSADRKYTLKINPMISLSNIEIETTAPLYETKDKIYVKSKALGTTFLGSINSVTSGIVNGVKVRDRGHYYTTGDYFMFTDGTQNLGRIDITETDTTGKIKSLNNINLRTGAYNNGYLSNFLEDVYVSIVNGGTNWKTLPDIEYFSTANFDSEIGFPYIQNVPEGFGIQMIPVSNNIGTLQSIGMNQSAYFLDSDDAQVAIPANVVIENTNLKKGDIVSFQHFNNEANFGPFVADSESVKIVLKNFRLFETHIETDYIYRESEIRTKYDITIPYGFDSDKFDWKWKNVRVDSKFGNFWEELEKVLDSESNLSYKITKRSFDTTIIDGGVFPSTYFVEVFHPFDEFGNKIDYDLDFSLGYSALGDFTDIDSAVFRLKSDKDSEVFDDVINFINNFHGGNVKITSAVMLDAEIVDGGPTFTFTVYDSEYEGGSFTSSSQSSINSWPSFTYTTAKYSYLKIEYPDIQTNPDSEVGYYDYDDWGFDIDSDNSAVTVINGGEFFGFAGATVEEIEIEYEGQFLSTLEHYHFDQLLNQTGLDSEYLTFDYDIVVGDKRLLEIFDDSDMGIWVDTGYFGEVVDVSQNGKVAKIIEWKDFDLPTQEVIDNISRNYREVVKLSKLENGVSRKDFTLPLTNVVHEIKRASLKYETSVVSSLIQKFYNQDGFISSDFGGTLQDNYFYSDWSYRIKSKLPLADWKDKFKTMLHPAGMVLTSEYIDTLSASVGTSQIDFDISDNGKTNLTFDMQNEYIDFGVISSDNINADNVRYTSNAFEAFNKDLGYAKQLDASNANSISNFKLKQQTGNSWWDYEPIGWIHTSTYDVPEINGNYVNLDSETFFMNRWSTQDSDNNGFVSNNYTYYKSYNGSRNDFYKNDSRIEKSKRANYLISKVQFENTLDNYSVYDSELPLDFMATFNDSDGVFKAIDYKRLENDNDNRSFFIAKVNRLSEVLKLKERDLALAMKENKSLVWDDSDKIYYDYDAYERKWNQVNNRRTINTEGYVIPGRTAFDSYYLTRKYEEYRKSSDIPATALSYSSINKPYTNVTWSQPSINWYNSYTDEINTIVNKTYVKETYRDPKVSMRGRRGR